MKKITSRFLNCTLALFVLFVCSCSTEETVSIETSDAQKWFNENVTKDDFPILNYVDKMDWKNAIVTTGDYGEVIEVPFTVQSGLKTKVGDENYSSYHRLLLKKSVDGFTYNHVQILTKNEYFDNTDKSFNLYQITDNFDGIVLVVNQNNEAVQFSSFKNSLLLKPSTNGRMAIQTCVYLGWQYENGDFRAISLVGCFGGAGADDSNNNGGYPPHVGGGGSGAESGTVATVITDSSFLNNPCLKAVFNKIGGSTVFQNYLKKFDGTFTVANLKLSASSNIASNINAETSPPVNYLIEISFNSNNLSRPGLDVARTFIHEMIHAEMFRKLLSLSSVNGEIDVLTLNQMLNQHNYPGLYDYYTRYGINGMQHEQMAAHYTETITNFLKEFDNSLSQEQYEAIALEGLKGTVTWNSKTEQEKQAITNTYNNWKSTAGISCN